MSQDQIIRPRNIPTITGLSLATIWRLQKKGLFPSRRRLSAGAVGYLQSEIVAWIEARKAVTAENCKPVAPTSRRGRKPKQ